MGWKRNVYKMLIGKHRGKRHLGRIRHARADKIKMDLKDTGFVYVDWIHLIYNKVQWLALVNIVMNI
jgi:predicted small integral membrane protein